MTAATAARTGGDTMKYLLLLRTADDGPPGMDTDAGRAMFAQYAAATEKMSAAGVLLECAPLTAASAATTVRVRDSQTLLSDGPAAEIREQVGGYTVLECATLDDALSWAALLPAAQTGSVEVRAIIDTSGSR